MPSDDSEPMPIQKPDVIEVSILHEEEIFADRAELYVTIKGSSLVTGNVALTKAREVHQLVTELTNYGLKQSDIRLQGVQTEVSTGLLGKSSSATYSLKIACSELDKLADLLGIVTAQKNTTLSSIAWHYSVDDEFSDNGLRDQWLDACLRRAQAKAARIAQGLGVKLLGVHHFTETYYSGNPRPQKYSPVERAYDYGAVKKRMSGKFDNEDLLISAKCANRCEKMEELCYGTFFFLYQSCFSRVASLPHLGVAPTGLETTCHCHGIGHHSRSRESNACPRQNGGNRCAEEPSASRRALQTYPGTKSPDTDLAVARGGSVWICGRCLDV